MKKIIIAALFMAGIRAGAEVPQGYYDSLDGKSGDALRVAVKAAATPAGFTTVTYNTKTWPAFEKTDVRAIRWGEDRNRMVWWDMYSNNIVFTDAHDSMNIEHSVANSWWGGTKNDAYKDLFHLNPSDQAANGQKGNLPLGEVETVAYANGLIKTGTPKAGSAGDASKVFEPADEYKGDFARAYFYIFTAYGDMGWKEDTAIMYDSEGNLRQWAAEMLLRWSDEDPVDSKEILRNEEIFKIQNNRNPYIDHPELAEYIWGGKAGEAYSLQPVAEAADRPEAPGCHDYWHTAINTYQLRWWDSVPVMASCAEGDLWMSIDGGEYDRYDGFMTFPAARYNGELHTVSAYVEKELGGKSLRSAVTRYTLVAHDPDVEDFGEALWTPVTNQSEIVDGEYYILVSSATGHVMGHNGGTTASKYMPDAGFVRVADGEVYDLPYDAAIVRLEAGTRNGENHLLRICMPDGMPKGYWNVSPASNNMTLNPDAGSVATISINDGDAEIDFGADLARTLKYNKAQVRFSNYGSNSSTASPVKLYRFSQHRASTGIRQNSDRKDEGGVAIGEGCVRTPEGWQIYDLNGRQIDGSSLEPGIYIAVSPRGRSVKLRL